MLPGEWHGQGTPAAKSSSALTDNPIPKTSASRVGNVVVFAFPPLLEVGGGGTCVQQLKGD